MARILSLAVVAALVVTFVTASAAQAADPAAKATAQAIKAPAAAVQSTAPVAKAPATSAPSAPRTATRTYRRYSYDPGYTGNYRTNSRAYANGIRDAASKSLGRYQPWSR